jgi:NAD(P)-dependent dehydrogenase (short-subunit alcohol dehydrogenase family)
MSAGRARMPVLHEHVAMVVGGGRGIGAATAVFLGRLGASVVVAARTRSEVARVSELVTAEGGEALSCVVDVRDPQSVAEMTGQALRRFDRLDHVVYCAGYVPEAALVWDVDPEELRTAFEVNVLGPALVARHVVPVMLDQREGNLVVVTSALPDWPIPAAGAYLASRAGENALVRTLAAEVRGSGVRVDVYTPPPTETGALRQFRAGLPGRRAPASALAAEDPGDVAQDVVRLCLPGWGRAGGRARPRAERRPRPFVGEAPAWRHPW